MDTSTLLIACIFPSVLSIFIQLCVDNQDTLALSL